MDWAIAGLVVSSIAIGVTLVVSVAGMAWRFGRIEKAIGSLEDNVRVLQDDVKRILERMPPA